ncbi:MAG: metallophosphoesterase [Bdellovibrionota bacterium]
MDKKKRVLFIGDVHGCYAEMLNLLKTMGYMPDKDRLIFVGDMTNKGPHSEKVLKFIYDNKCEAILGNHELDFLHKIKQGKPHPLTNQLNALDFWISWLEKLPLFIDTKEFLAVHAGICPNMELTDMPATLLTTIRTWDGKGQDLQNPKNPPWFELYHEEKLIIYGHWAAMGLTVRQNTIGLDSGCCYGGQLSGLELPSRKIFQIDSIS